MSWGTSPSPGQLGASAPLNRDGIPVPVLKKHATRWLRDEGTPLTCNLEVAHEHAKHRSNRKTDSAPRPAIPGLAGPDRRRGVRRLVPGEAGGPLRPRPVDQGEDDLARLRAHHHGGGGRTDGGGGPVRG